MVAISGAPSVSEESAAVKLELVWKPPKPVFLSFLRKQESRFSLFFLDPRLLASLKLRRSGRGDDDMRVLSTF